MLGHIISFIIGAWCGILTMCLCTVAKHSDEDIEAMMQEKDWWENQDESNCKPE